MTKLMLLAGAAICALTSSAYAAVPEFLSETVFGQWSSGGPGISNLNVPISVPDFPSSDTVPVFTLSPDSICEGPGCAPDGNGVGFGVESDPITIQLGGLIFNGNAIPAVQFTGEFSAAYGGPILPCAAGDGVSPATGETDCFVWSGAPNTFDGSITHNIALDGVGDVLSVTLWNASDWNVTPNVTFDIVTSEVGGVPELSTWIYSVIGFGLLGLGGLYRTREKRYAL